MPKAVFAEWLAKSANEVHQGPWMKRAKIRRPEAIKVSNEEILSALRLVGQETLVERAGGLDVPQEWNNMLSLGTQQLLVIARLLISKESFAVLDRIATALNPEETELALSALRLLGVTYITFGNSSDDRHSYDAVLDIEDDGSWHWVKAAEGAPSPRHPATTRKR